MSEFLPSVVSPKDFFLLLVFTTIGFIRRSALYDLKEDYDNEGQVYSTTPGQVDKERAYKCMKDFMERLGLNGNVDQMVNHMHELDAEMRNTLDENVAKKVPINRLLHSVGMFSDVSFKTL